MPVQIGQAGDKATSARNGAPRRVKRCGARAVAQSERETSPHRFQGLVERLAAQARAGAFVDTAVLLLLEHLARRREALP